MDNSTDAPVLLESTTAPNYDQSTLSSYVEETFVEKLQKYWYYLFCHTLGMFLSILVIYLSLFNKKYINGDYKWFVLSQAIACLLQSFARFLYFIVVNCALGQDEYYKLYYSNSRPLWMTLFAEILIFEIDMKLGENAQLTTLFATVFNRWLAIILPSRYAAIMKPRLIFLYCILCFLILLPNDSRLYYRLSFSDYLLGVTTQSILLIPWISSALLNAMVFVKLLKHQRIMTNVIDQRRIKESRSIVISVFLQILIPLLDRLPTFSYAVFMNFHIYTEEEYYHSRISKFMGYVKLVTLNLSPTLTCLTILLSMRPYRQALFSTLSLRTRFFKQFSKQTSSNKISTQTVSVTRTPVISIRSIASNNSVGIVVPP